MPLISVAYLLYYIFTKHVHVLRSLIRIINVYVFQMCLISVGIMYILILKIETKCCFLFIYLTTLKRSEDTAMQQAVFDCKYSCVLGPLKGVVIFQLFSFPRSDSTKS